MPCESSLGIHYSIVWVSHSWGNYQFLVAVTVIISSESLCFENYVFKVSFLAIVLSFNHLVTTVACYCNLYYAITRLWKIQVIWHNQICFSSSNVSSDTTGIIKH